MFDRLRRAVRRFTGRPVLSAEERRRLEEWTRLRFRLGSSDPVGTTHTATPAKLMQEAERVSGLRVEGLEIRSTPQNRLLRPPGR